MRARCFVSHALALDPTAPLPSVQWIALACSEHQEWSQIRCQMVYPDFNTSFLQLLVQLVMSAASIELGRNVESVLSASRFHSLFIWRYFTRNDYCNWNLIGNILLFPTREFPVGSLWYVAWRILFHSSRDSVTLFSATTYSLDSNVYSQPASQRSLASGSVAWFRIILQNYPNVIICIIPQQISQETSLAFPVGKRVETSDKLKLWINKT
jgi:hypothetical protein